MRMTLTEAPAGAPMELIAISEPELAVRLRRLGVEEGTQLTRDAETIATPSVRLQVVQQSRQAEATHGAADVTLSGELAARVLAHLDDDRKLPLPELALGDEGHVEGLVSGTALARALEALGLREGDRIRMARRLPPMRFAALLREGDRARGRVGLSEGQAAMVLGRLVGDEGDTAVVKLLQFAMARVGAAFLVETVLGDASTVKPLERLGVVPGVLLSLEDVTPSQEVSLAGHASIRLVTQTGLAFLVHPHDAARMTVRMV